jgi:hypothetical protein
VLDGRLVTAAARAEPKPAKEEASGTVSSSNPTQRLRRAHEQSLLEMMSLGHWRAFVFESIVLLGLISLLPASVLAGSTAAGGMPHPFWIPVLLMSCQYGVMGGLFATLAATAWFFIGGVPAQSATQDFYDYARVVAGQPCAWFGTALVLGGLRTLHIHNSNELQKQLDQMESASEDLADGLERAVGEIERLERRIAVDASTLTSFTDSLARLDLNDRPSLVAGLADVIHHGVGATSFAVYLKGPNGMEPVLGVRNGVRLVPTAIGPLPPRLLDDIRRGALGRSGPLPAKDEEGTAEVPEWAPIRLPNSAELVGVVVCARLQTSQDPEIAWRRLDHVCRLLAVLLSAHPEAVAGARQRG